MVDGNKQLSTINQQPNSPLSALRAHVNYLTKQYFALLKVRFNLAITKLTVAI
jgi:hypothetical protein